MHELRQKMLKEFKTPAKYLTSEQKKDKMLEIRDQFIPEKKKMLFEMSFNLIKLKTHYFRAKEAKRVKKA